MKKILLSALIISFCLPVFAKPNYSYTNVEANTTNTGVYVNEEITNPITQIGIPAQYLHPQQQDEEKWLEIEWNQWRADAYNYFFNQIKTEVTPANSLMYYVFTVNKSREISDIFIFKFQKESGKPKYSIKEKKNPDKPDFQSSFYLCMKNPKENIFKIYSFNIKEDAVLGQDTIMNTLKRAEFSKTVADESMPAGSLKQEFKEMLNAAKKIEKMSGQPVFAFPAKSQRDEVVIRYAMAAIALNLRYFSPEDYDSSDFNDVERIKQ